jgi:hypothetical protein
MRIRDNVIQRELWDYFCKHPERSTAAINDSRNRLNNAIDDITQHLLHLNL